MTERLPVDLTNCDREPIHIPGSIQPHGFLLACDIDLNVVRRHSANAAAFLGASAHELAHARLEELIGESALHALRNALAGSLDPARAGLLQGLSVGDPPRLFDVAVHRHDEDAIVEFEPVGEQKARAPLDLARALVTRLRKLGGTELMLNDAARLVRGLLGYDRVMVYRFDADGSGHVVSESKRSDLEPFLGLHYPASDIPQQARALYLKNTIRVICDIDAERVPIVPELDEAEAPLDLSYAHLRSVSPIHCEYLRNMGVAASMSVSIVVDGELWGLIACHHYAPHSLTMAQRVAAEMFGEYFSLHLEASEHKRKLEAARRARASLDTLFKRVAQESDALAVLQNSLPELEQLMPCDGVGLFINGTWMSRGSTPPPEAVPELMDYLAGVVHGQVWSTNALCDALPSADAYCPDAAGVLVVALSQIPRDYALFFRKEVIQTVNWAGNPEKQYETGPHGDRLTPRKSFALWKESVERRAIPWAQSDLDIAESVRIALLEIVLRHTERVEAERAKAAARQRTLNRELNHRVKNILALIKSLVTQPSRQAGSTEEFVQILRGRIQALADAHDQVIRGGGSLHDLLKAELKPYRDAGGLTVDGPPVGLEGRAFSVLALVIHELATNAAKYGALSVPQGTVAVRWTTNPDGACEILWRESGGPPVTPPHRRGFGSRLLQRAVSFDLGGESDVDYAESGVVARFLIPARFVSSAAPAAAEDFAAPVVSRSDPRALAGLRVLVVEDHFVIALDVESMLLDGGAGSVQLAATAREALRHIARERPDVAVLDFNLGQGTSLPVAEELARLGIPFIFATGYGDSQSLPAAFAEIPRARKPFDGDALFSRLLEVLPPGP